MRLSTTRPLFMLAAFCVPVAGAAVRSDGCAVCHPAIFESYRQTPMAVSSGVAGRAVPAETFARAGFTLTATPFRYRVSRSGGNYWMEFDKAGDDSLHGRKRLAYFVGSGAVARSYVLSAGGFLYEAPVAYYSADAKWDLAPAYDGYAYPYLTRPILPGCLNCHASFLEVVPGTQNRFAAEPFREGGVACERCHGAGEAHVEKMRAGEPGGDPLIVNPARLAPEVRDSVCAQCHLSGEVRVMRPGATWSSYHAGGRLAGSITVFVRTGATPGLRVTSHYEKLAQSACKRSAGDRLWCGTCHDPHTVPAAAERAGWFRRKCLGCHVTRGCTETRINRSRQQDDCTACHMPKSPVTDAQHVVYTDHSIPRRPRAESPSASRDAELIPFGGGTASPRDLALAYAIAASRTHAMADRQRAVRLLEETVRVSPDDSEVLLYLAEIYRNDSQDDRAIPLYRRAMQLDPTQVTASVGLGGILFQRGEFREAIRLWQDALSKNSGLVLVATNLAMAQWRAGDLLPAVDTIRGVVSLSPGFQPARDLLKRLEALLPNR
ncbi:MAG TPA: tetratricopeptide repeat protein [Candidatus Sulfopaludibacter sp.]|nr:tetratricopeptide repeat protein [Candidatus Sulfopaludibacter sp.]